MTHSLSWRQNLRESLPSMFEVKKPSWPNPQDSIGQECLNVKFVNGLRCWQVVGPALEVMEKLCVPIKDLLDKHQELLEQGESKPRAMSFEMWMLGALPTSAQPTIVFSSKSKRQRTYAKVLLKKSKLLDEYPSLQIKALDRMPAVYQSAERVPEANTSIASDNDVFLADESCEPCGALITFGHAKMATMGGVLLINGVHYGISAQHARHRPLAELEDNVPDSGPLCFDDDSDIENDDLMDITSAASISCYSDDEVCSDSYESLLAESIFDAPYKPQAQSKDHCSSQLLDGVLQRGESSARQISSLPTDYTETDLDYEIFQLDDVQLQGPNSIHLPGSHGSPSTYIKPKGIMRNLLESDVWAATGTTGSVSGIILKSPVFIKMERSQRFQEMWTVKLDRKTMQGDCGAWVIEASTGNICGHIVAGCPTTGVAFIIPAYKVFEDIEHRLGTTPVLPMSEDVNISSLRGSSKTTQQLARLPFTSDAILRLIVAWLLWYSQNSYMTYEERRRLILLMFSSSTFRRCLESLNLLIDPIDYAFCLETGTLPQGCRAGFSRGFIYSLEFFELDCNCLSFPDTLESSDIGAAYLSFGTAIDQHGHRNKMELDYLQLPSHEPFYPDHSWISNGGEFHCVGKASSCSSFPRKLRYKLTRRSHRRSHRLTTCVRCKLISGRQSCLPRKAAVYGNTFESGAWVPMFRDHQHKRQLLHENHRSLCTEQSKQRPPKQPPSPITRVTPLPSPGQDSPSNLSAPDEMKQNQERAIAAILVLPDSYTLDIRNNGTFVRR